MMKNFLSVDLQNEFTTKGGKDYKYRPSVDFIKETLVPYFETNNLKLAEIISDYRQPRPGDRGDGCHPGTWGYESIIPDTIKKEPVWIKCMNSPIWTRDNIGNSKATPGIPYQDGDLFQNWLDKTIGPKNKGIEVILFGLTIDCCVLATAQELNWRGYKVKILNEAVDTYSGELIEKEMILNNVPLSNWAKVINWQTILEVT